MDARKVLIIDDEKLLVKSTIMALRAFGFDAVGALDGDEGIKTAVESRPDIILLDIMMPGKDGWQVLKELKNREQTSGIPVIVFTAKEYPNGKSMAAENGATDYIAKPFELEELVEMLKRYPA